MNLKAIGYALLVIGIAVGIVSWLADDLGIGMSEGIGSLQLMGITFGVILALYGAYYAFIPDTEGVEEPTFHRKAE